ALRVRASDMPPWRSVALCVLRVEKKQNVPHGRRNDMHKPRGTEPLRSSPMTGRPGYSPSTTERSAMLTIEPTGAILGATVRGIDAREVDDERFAQILLALGRHGVLRFPDQQLDMGDLRRFSERFGDIQGPSIAENDAAHVGTLSNLKEDGK